MTDGIAALPTELQTPWPEGDPGSPPALAHRFLSQSILHYTRRVLAARGSVAGIEPACRPKPACQITVSQRPGTGKERRRITVPRAAKTHRRMRAPGVPLTQKITVSPRPAPGKTGDGAARHPHRSSSEDEERVRYHERGLSPRGRFRGGATRAQHTVDQAEAANLVSTATRRLSAADCCAASMISSTCSACAGVIGEGRSSSRQSTAWLAPPCQV